MVHPYYTPPGFGGTMVDAVKTELAAKEAKEIERGPLRSITEAGKAFPTMALTRSVASIAENADPGTFGFTITLSAPAPNNITITPTWGGTATNVTDYTRTAGATWTILAGATEFEVECDLAAEPNVSVNETVILTIAATDANGYPIAVTDGGALSQTITITPV